MRVGREEKASKRGRDVGRMRRGGRGKKDKGKGCGQTGEWRRRKEKKKGGRGVGRMRRKG